MKQIFQHRKSGNLEILDVPTPTIKPGEVLVRNHFSIISSGTERSVVELGKKNLLEKIKARPDLVKEALSRLKTEGVFSVYKKAMQVLNELVALGYSSAGQVIAVGKEVENFKAGDKVACGGQDYASHAEIINIPKNLCIKIPDNVSFKEAAFTTLGAIALQGIRRAELTSGEKVAVIGLGLLGQLTVQILKAYGFPVIGVDIKNSRVERALKSGMDKGGVIGRDDIEDLVRSFTNGTGIDAVIITAATKSNQPIELAGKILREKGKVSAVGLIGMTIPRPPYYEKELDFLVSRSYGPGRYDTEYEEKGHDYPLGYVRWTEKRNMEEFLRLVSEKKVLPENLITHIFDVEEAEEAYKLILENPSQQEISGVLFSYDVKKEQEDIVFLKEVKKHQKKEQINVGLIGAGHFAQGIALPILQKIKGVRIYGIADIEAGKARKIAEKYQAKFVTSNYQKIIGDENIDLVIITTRHDLHAKFTIEALKNNKNVHVEKPLALNQEELAEIINAAKASQGRLMVGFNRRFTPHIQEAKEIFTEEDYPLMMVYRVNAGFFPSDHWVHESGGRIPGEVCHFVDLLQFLAGSPPKRVYTTLIPLIKGVNAQDNVIVSVDFANGSRGVIVYTSLGSKKLPKDYIEIYGSGKAMIIDDFKKADIFTKEGKRSLRVFGQDKGYKGEFEKFIKAIQDGKASPISLEELFYSTKAISAIIQSIKEGRPIDI